MSDASSLRRAFVFMGLTLMLLLGQEMVLGSLFAGFVFVPDLLLLLVVYWALIGPTAIGVCAAFLLGLFSAMAQGSLLGAEALSYLFAYWVVSVLRQGMFVESWKRVAVAAGISSVVANLVYGTTLFFLGRLASVFSLRDILLWEALGIMLLAPLVMPLLARADGRHRDMSFSTSTGLV
jgi:rod shape-determining protein MreD